MSTFRKRLKRAIQKTWPETALLLRGRAPRFVYGGEVRELPVFTYHAVSASFEKDLIALREGGYRTLDAADLAARATGERRTDGRDVVLTFDDGHESLTRVAAPLLADHGFVGIAFVVSGLVPESARDGLSGWAELNPYVERGTLQIGSHSLYHHQVPIAPEIEGFVAPASATGFSANLPIPRYRGEEEPLPGTPILRGAPRYLARRAFRPDRDVLRRFVEAAAAQGPDFFNRRGWSGHLRAVAEIRGDHETTEEADLAVVEDMRRSMELIEERCPNPASRHLCYPWYAGDDRSDRLAALAGVRVLYVGIPDRGRERSGGGAPRVDRLPPDFLGRLPGPRRVSLASLAGRRFRVMLSGPS